MTMTPNQIRDEQSRMDSERQMQSASVAVGHLIGLMIALFGLLLFGLALMR